MKKNFLVRTIPLQRRLHQKTDVVNMEENKELYWSCKVEETFFSLAKNGKDALIPSPLELAKAICNVVRKVVKEGFKRV